MSKTLLGHRTKLNKKGQAPTASSCGQTTVILSRNVTARCASHVLEYYLRSVVMY